MLVVLLVSQLMFRVVEVSRSLQASLLGVDARERMYLFLVGVGPLQDAFRQNVD